MVFVKAGLALKHYNITYKTLYSWKDKGLIRIQANPSGSYLFWIEDREEDLETGPLSIGSHIVYARVSSKKQEGELQNQVDFLKRAYPTYDVVTDIGSGINYKRKGLQTILESLYRGQIKEVVVVHKDRLSRIGYDFFESLFKRFGASLKAIKSQCDTPDEELAKDLLEVITVFSARYHGRRSYSNESEDIPITDSKDLSKKITRGYKKAL